MWSWYYKLLARRPHLVLISTAVISIACIAISLTFKRFPDFTDPSLGFETRGTAIANRHTAWKNLLEETRPSGKLVANPYDNLKMRLQLSNKRNNTTKHGRKNKTKIHFKKKMKFIKQNAINQTLTNNFNFFDENDDHVHSNGSHHEHWDYGTNLSYVNSNETEQMQQTKKDQWKMLRNFNPPSSTTVIHIPTDGFFCESPSQEYGHIVVGRMNRALNESLLELDALLAMCDLETKLTQVEYYRELCQIEVGSQKCCRPWSIPNYVALLSNRSSCFDLEEEDVTDVKRLLLDCYEHYRSFKLSNDCINKKCQVPIECQQHNAVYNIIHFLADSESIKESNVYLTNSMIFLPIAKSSAALPFFYNMGPTLPFNDIVGVVALDLGIKNALFDECLIKDGWLVCLGALFVLMCIWMYTNSFFITVMTVIANIFALGISYFIYTFLFELPYFPFMNLLAVIVLVGIGADDVFIFIKLWQCAIAERTKVLGIPISSSSEFPSSASDADTLAGLISCTLRHAAASILVTSLTTALAFYTSYLSSITAIQCFGIFAGTVVMVNYLLMMTWLPASVSLNERISCYALKWWIQALTKINSTATFMGIYLQNKIIIFVIKMPFLWIFLFGAIGFASSIIVFYRPGFHLPNTPNFQLFSSDHPFEIYETKFKNAFWFEKVYTDMETFKLPIRFVWGIQPVDDGNYLVPSSRGSLHLDGTLNISSVEAQQWLLHFCEDLKRQPFYQMSLGPPWLPNCFIENFIGTMQRRCNDGMSGIDRTPCCESSKFPYPPHIFDECLPQIISILYESPRYIFIPGIAGPKFGRLSLPAVPLNSSASMNVTAFMHNHPPPVKALVVEYESTQSYTMSFTEIENFTTTVEQWFESAMASAPAGMQNAWFISELNFYDLQRTLSCGTLIAIAIAMTTSLVILLLVTLNVFISIFAVLTVTLTIITTIACLVLLGWKLNVLESIAVSTAIGLAVDFTLHFGVNYRLSPLTDRVSAVRFSMSRMIGPTIMAAITTGAAGAFMIPSSVLAYTQIGSFLLIVMSISWLYGTFFFASLLCAMGPQHNFGQIRLWARKKPDNKNAKNHIDHGPRLSTQGTVSEQLLSASSSAAGEFIGSESHELNSLNSNSIVKSVHAMDTRPITFDRAFKPRLTSYLKDQSPTSASAITEVYPNDEIDYERSHM